jgi:PAS domain S-box-containing protein
MQSAGFDIVIYVVAIGAALAGALISFLIMQHRAATSRCALEAQIEDLSDRLWEGHEAEERARSLLEGHGDLIVRRDSIGRITYANDAFCALAGKSRERLLGNVVELPVLERTTATVQPDGTRTRDESINLGTGTRWISWRDVAVRAEAGTEIQSVGHDVTSHVEAARTLALARDQAQATSRTKSRFLATLSHEIRTPLNGILGMAGLLLDTQLTAEQSTYAKAAKASGETLLALIEEILDFSKIEAGRLDIESHPFALAAMVEEAVELMAPRAQAKGVEIVCYVDERIPANVIGDAARLRQVLLNLISNAVKFTEKGGVGVVVEPSDFENEIRLEVRDTGIGIKNDNLSRIFQDFEQGDNSSTRKFGGTGLGLAISKRIIERMDGRIDVTSDVGVGSVFCVSLRLPPAETQEANFVGPDLAHMAVMIVTAAEIEASLLARRLGRWGASTCAVVDERVATALLPERPWEALIVDFPLARVVAETCNLGKLGIPKRIVMIRPSERHELPALKACGFTGYLVKPVRAASLAARLDTADTFEHSAAAIAAESTEVSSSTAKGLSILVAEDNDINALLARALLTRLGHHPTIATNGEVAVESWLAARAAGSRYDLVLMDLQMPGIDGLEAARRIRAAEAEAGDPRTRIVALTANAQTEDRQSILDAGLDDLLLKPLDRERLREILKTVSGPGANPLAA